MTNQMPPEMEAELEEVLADMQLLEQKAWELVAFTDEIIQRKELEAIQSRLGENQPSPEVLNAYSQAIKSRADVYRRLATR